MRIVGDFVALMAMAMLSPIVWVSLLAIGFGLYMHGRSHQQLTSRWPILVLPFVPGIALDIWSHTASASSTAPYDIGFWLSTLVVIGVVFWLARGFRWFALAVVALSLWVNLALAARVAMRLTGEGP